MQYENLFIFYQVVSSEIVNIMQHQYANEKRRKKNL